MSDNAYEKFRLTLTMNLCKVLPADQLAAALEAVDVTMDEYEITRKRMELITADGVPEVVKIFIAAKAYRTLLNRHPRPVPVPPESLF